MRVARSVTHQARLLGAVGFAALLAGCAEQQPAEPHARPKLETGSENSITVNSEITLYDKRGVESRKYNKTQQLQTQMVGGILGATVVAPGGGARANIQIDDGSAVEIGRAHV